MSALKIAKLGVWSSLNGLILAIDEGLIESQNQVAFPELSDPSDNAVMQWLSMLILVQWSNKYFVDLVRLLNYESLHYLKNEIYYWYHDANYPIAEKLYTYSQFYKFLDQANVALAANRSANCQEYLKKVLVQMRLALNQWVWKTFQGDFNAQIAIATQALAQCQ